ncbi:MAG: carbon monoxide dehydrogenase subunit G [Burkholderiaceae bacterium]|jgi:carbon monoxide dehydrogenase subunit G|nr:carbon monoxide dehydrogenase subunit G [Burkholderiaceae bacterium]MEB2351946.1 carbon monoxide dehydrogenase subunit G [Burkholderiaceae bacterium]
MNLQGERLIAATPDATWAALNDPETLKACIAGCETLDRVADDEFLATMAMRIGPVNARFKGRLKLQDVVPPVSYTIAFDGQGGVAGFGKGSADVRLAPEATGTRLTYAARAQVGGKLAQVGSRLVEGAAAKITDDFFAAFEARLAPAPAVADAAAAAPGMLAERAAGAPPASAAARRRWLVWIVVALVAAALVSYLLR